MAKPESLGATQTASHSTRALLDRLIDYAGLFPPAKLPLPAAVEMFAAHRQSPFAWMLGKFICPAAGLPEFAALAEKLIQPADCWPVSVLGRSASTSTAFLENLPADLEAMTACVRSSAPRISIESLEVRLPDDIVAAADASAIGVFLDEAARIIDRIWRSVTAPDQAGPRMLVPPLSTYYEIPLGENWRSRIKTIISGMTPQLQLGAFDRRISAAPAAKLRTGGVEASSFPSSEQVACFMHECNTARVRFKATAGLHHPLRHFNQSVNTKMHGFLNVFAGAALLNQPSDRKPEFGEHELRELLESEDFAEFSFTDEGLSWREHRASLNAIAESRSNLAAGFGSCSFDEPIEDLLALGLI